MHSDQDIRLAPLSSHIRLPHHSHQVSWFYLLNMLFCPSSWPVPREQDNDFSDLEAMGDLEKTLFRGAIGGRSQPVGRWKWLRGKGCNQHVMTSLSKSLAVKGSSPSTPHHFKSPCHLMRMPFLTFFIQPPNLSFRFNSSITLPEPHVLLGSHLGTHCL